MTKLFLLCGMIGGMVTANLLLKIGVGMSDGLRLHPGAPAINAYVLGSVSAFGGAFVFYMFLLRTMPLNVAQSFAAAQFIAIILAANIVLDESISLLQWSGILLIASGIMLVSLSTS